MKLYKLCLDLYEMYGNIPAKYTVITPEIGEKFSTTYEGKRCRFGGGDGRLGDIPAYLGGCEVVAWHVDLYQTGEYKAVIEI